MTKQDKELLIKDLCTRLPYGMQGASSEFEGNISPLLTIGEADWDILTSLNYRIVKHGWRPYLRPMSSMTEKEKKEYCDLQAIFLYSSQYPVTDAYALFDWLNAHHFDYRGLIPMGLALPALEGMYNF